MTRRVEVELDKHASLVRGYNARTLVEQASGRAPVWIFRRRGWSCSEQSARDVVALAEALNYDVAVIGRQDRRRQALDALRAAPAPLDFGGRR